MDVLDEYITETIVRYCNQNKKSKEFNYQIETENTQSSSVVNAYVYSHPYHDSIISILEIDYNNKFLKLQRANGILFKESLNDIGIDDHLTVIDSWSDNKGNIFIPFNMVESMLSSQKNMKKAIGTIVANTVGYAYGMQIIEKIAALLSPIYTEHANLSLNLNSGNIHSAVITVENNLWRNGIIKGDLLFAKLKTNGKNRYINFKSSLAYLFKSINLDYSANNTEEKNGLIRIDLDNFMLQINNTTKEFQRIMDTALLRAISFNEFGCCSKYAECEKAGRCMHVDQLYATACQYQNLMKRTGKFE